MPILDGHVTSSTTNVSIEVELEHGALCHYINGNPKIDQSVWNNGAIDVHIY